MNLEVFFPTTTLGFLGWEGSVTSGTGWAMGRMTTTAGPADHPGGGRA